MTVIDLPSSTIGALSRQSLLWHKANFNTYPPHTIVVLDTLGAGNRREYRIGLLTEYDFVEGLRCPRDGLRLNPPVARRCFENSPLYFDEARAEKAARALYPEEETGIKILQFHEPWPGVPCRAVS